MVPKARITRQMIDEEIEWAMNLQLSSAWNHIRRWEEDDMRCINRCWRESDETCWQTFIINYAETI